MRTSPLSCIAVLLSVLTIGRCSCAQGSTPEVSFSGFFDGYYSYNSNRPKPVTGLSPATVSSAGIPQANDTYHYYDTYTNQFTLSLVELTVKAVAKDIFFLADFDFGSFADLNAAASSTSGVVTDESSKHVGQAVLTYKPEGSPFIFEAGKMYSHMGVETAKSKDNFNYSRSLLFSYGIPFWHTGVHFGYEAVPDKVQASLYVYNGWNTLYSTNRSKTVGAQIRYTPAKDVAIAYNFIGGQGRADSESDWKVVHEVNASFPVSQTVTVIADSVFGSEDDAVVAGSHARAQWYGAVVGARYQSSEYGYVGSRLEIYRDSNGGSLAGPAQTIDSITLTYGRELTTNFEFRLEGRSDFSTESIFVSDAGTSKTQTTALVACLYKF